MGFVLILGNAGFMSPTVVRSRVPHGGPVTRFYLVLRRRIWVGGILLLCTQDALLLILSRGRESALRASGSGRIWGCGQN